MKEFSVKIISVPCDDQKAITAVQMKLNQWMTIGKLKKYEMHTTATHIIFNIMINKEAE